jgi:hypothetical protein
VAPHETFSPLHVTIHKSNASNFHGRSDDSTLYLQQQSNILSAMATETKRLLLYTYPTPNGRRVSVLLEELKAAYGLEYE